MSKQGTEIANEPQTPKRKTDDPIVTGDDAGLFEFNTPPVTEAGADFIGEQADPEPRRAQEDTPENYRGQLDGKGQAYDPLLHDYPPSQTPTGKWKKRPKNKPAPEIPEGQGELLGNSAYRAEAEKMALLYANAHRIPFGENGKIEKDPLMPLVDDLERYMMENGHQSISPGWAVLMDAAVYSMVICQREPNKEKLKKWFSPLLNIFKRKKKNNVVDMKTREPVKNEPLVAKAEKPEVDKNNPPPPTPPDGGVSY